jgi:hypothetical protein
MQRLSTIIALLVAALPALAKLEIKNVQPAHGPLGPARTSDDVYPLDEYLVRYQVAGVKANADGKAELEVSVRLTNADGKVVYETKPTTRKFDLSLGGDVVQTYGFVTFSEKAPPGEYKLTVTVRDKVSNESASFDRKITCKPASFQIIVPRFYHDSDASVPAGTTLLVGETLHYRFRVIGFDTSQKRVGLIMRAVMVDADGKSLGARPLEVKGETTDPVKADTRRAAFSGQAALHRAGEFKLRVEVEDTIGKKLTTFETPIKVVAP